MNDNVVVVNTNKKTKKNGMNPLVVVIVLVLIAAGIACYFIFGNKKDEKNNSTDPKNGAQKVQVGTKDATSCGTKCYNYDLSSYLDGKKLFNVNLKNEDINFDIEFLADGEMSEIRLSTDGKEAYHIVGGSVLTDYIKIYLIGDYYVLEYRSSTTNCGEVKTVLFTKNGEFVGIPANDENSLNEVTINYGPEVGEGTVLPALYKTEINGNNVTAYTKVCGFCEGNSNVIGYKYNYSINDNKLAYTGKTELYCKDIAE